ncbi:MAG TPA: hypothetical protein VL443_04525 [Cyclobacteriaceae bacterium]|jgi:hypothetical protein|nr:hypothetical protein [Cyclobacteriaceae bacterium]
MTPNEFENLLIQTRTNLMSAFQHGQVSDSDTYAKAIIDYQEFIAKHLFKELNTLQTDLTKTKGDILKDSRERFELLMKAIKEK